MTRYEELCVRKDQLEAQLREIRRNMEMDDDQEGQEYLLAQLDEVQAEIDRLEVLIEREDEVQAEIDRVKALIEREQEG